MTMLPVPTRLTQVGVAGRPDAWAEVGFAVSPGGFVAVENGALAFDGRAHDNGLLGLGVGGLPGSLTDAEADGIAVTVADPVPPTDHDNGAYELDHVVIVTPSLEVTSRHVTAVLGLRQLRVRAEARQAFHRFADVERPDGSTARGCICEIVERRDAERAALWGVVFTTDRLDEVAASLGPSVIGEPRKAVQPGRRIATFRRAAGLGVATALMSPHVSSSQPPA